MIPVLIGDDDTDIRDAISFLLREEGYEPTEVASHNAALSLLDERAFALILTDLFSHGHGSEAKTVASLVERAHPTPVGLITGWPMTQEEIAASRCAFYMRKPFDIDDLLTSIAAAISATLTPERQRQAERVRRYFAALSEKNWDALIDLCAEDVVYVLPGGSPLSQTVHGKPAFRAYSEETFRHFPDARFEHVRIYATPQGLAARYEGVWADGQEERRQAGSVVFQFTDLLIRQIGVQLNEAQLNALMTSPSASTSA